MVSWYSCYRGTQEGGLVMVVIGSNSVDYHEYDYRRNGTTQSIMPINRKNDNFREKKNSQVMKERENLH